MILISSYSVLSSSGFRKDQLRARRIFVITLNKSKFKYDKQKTNSTFVMPVCHDRRQTFCNIIYVWHLALIVNLTIQRQNNQQYDIIEDFCYLCSI